MMMLMMLHYRMDENMFSTKKTCDKISFKNIVPGMKFLLQYLDWNSLPNPVATRF